MSLHHLLPQNARSLPRGSESANPPSATQPPAAHCHPQVTAPRPHEGRTPCGPPRSVTDQWEWGVGGRRLGPFSPLPVDPSLLRSRASPSAGHLPHTHGAQRREVSHGHQPVCYGQEPACSSAGGLWLQVLPKAPVTLSAALPWGTPFQAHSPGDGQASFAHHVGHSSGSPRHRPPEQGRQGEHTLKTATGL